MAPDLSIQPLMRRIFELESSARAAADWIELAALYEQLQQLDPLDHRLPANRGNALWLSDRAQDALRCYWRAAFLDQSNPVVLRGLGNVHLDLNAFELAERAYVRSLALEQAALTAWNYSQLLIGMERYVEGYRLAEQRWAMPGHVPWRDPSTDWAATPEQLCEPLLVWSEQGLGDTLQHLRWIGPLQNHRGPAAKPLVLEVEPCLAPLLQQSIGTQAGSIEVRAKASAGPETFSGRHVSLLSLPWLLGGAPLPAEATWLTLPEWRPPRPWPSREPRIGLVWGAGRKLNDPVTAREYYRRSLRPETLGLLIEGLHRLGAGVVLLQFGEDRAMADPWRHLVADELPVEADFGATAAVVADLDLVITVDTSMAHLVGAMQRRGWLLLPHGAAPRWLRQRDDTPWYPSLRLFRQPSPSDWHGLVKQVLRELKLGLERNTAAISSYS